MFKNKCFVQRVDARVVDIRVERETAERFWGSKLILDTDNRKN